MRAVLSASTTAGYGEAVVTGQRAGPLWPGERRCADEVPPRGREARRGVPGGSSPGLTQRAGPLRPGERRCAGESPQRGAKRGGGYRGVVPPGQHSREGAEGAAAVADRVLGLGGHLGCGQAGPVGQEDRVVAEPPAAARAAHQLPVQSPLDDVLAAVRQRQRGRTNEVRAAVRVSDVGELRQDQSEVGGVVAVPAGPSRPIRQVLR